MCFPMSEEDEEKERKMVEKEEKEQKEEPTSVGTSTTIRIDIDLLEQSNQILIDKEIATVAFAQAQMTTIDEEVRSSADARRDSSEFATYVEYLEAIVRVAMSTMQGLEVEMMTTPQKLERFLCTVLFPKVGIPEHMFGTGVVVVEEVVEEVVVKKKGKKKKGSKKKGKKGKKKGTKKGSSKKKKKKK